jgi:uncharacterized protein YbjQ (UPF0145 family)
MAKDCSKCGKGKGFFTKPLISLQGNEYCNECAEIIIDEATSKIILTTTNNVDGHVVLQYVDIESVEVVMGTGMFSEFGGEVADFFGTRSTAFESKLQKAKKVAFKKLKYLAFERGANAVIGIDIDYTEFSGNRIGLIANGTLVKIAPLPT